jgi:hypothetical protein
MTRIARLIGLVGLTILVGVSFVYSLPRAYLGDVAVFIGAGRLAALGQNPYGIADITPSGPGGIPFPNLSPPLSVLFFQQIAWIDPISVFRIWYGIGLVLYILILYAFIRAYPGRQSTIRIVWAGAIFPIWLTLGIGQVQVELLALATVAWLALPVRRDLLAGLAIGILILWPVVVYGPIIYREWIDASVRTMTGIGGYGLISFLANAGGLSQLSLPLSGLIVIGSLWWAWRAQPSALRASEVALIVSLLALPVTNAAYFVLLIPIFLGRVWNLSDAVAAFLLLVPWQLFMPGRLPWPYAIVLILLLGDIPSVGGIRNLVDTARVVRLRRSPAPRAT